MLNKKPSHDIKWGGFFMQLSNVNMKKTRLIQLLVFFV